MYEIHKSNTIYYYEHVIVLTLRIRNNADSTTCNTTGDNCARHLSRKNLCNYAEITQSLKLCRVSTILQPSLRRYQRKTFLD